MYAAPNSSPVRSQPRNSTADLFCSFSFSPFPKDGIALCKRFKNENFLFDKILLDAPCSGEGTIRSTPATFEMWNIKTIENLSKLQKSLIASAIEILKPNGELVYSTCTHSPEENESVVDFALKNFPVKIESINIPMKCRPGVIAWEKEDYNKDELWKKVEADLTTYGFHDALYPALKNNIRSWVYELPEWMCLPPKAKDNH